MTQNVAAQVSDNADNTTQLQWAQDLFGRDDAQLQEDLRVLLRVLSTVHVGTWAMQHRLVSRPQKGCIEIF